MRAATIALALGCVGSQAPSGIREVDSSLPHLHAKVLEATQHPTIGVLGLEDLSGTQSAFAIQQTMMLRGLVPKLSGYPLNPNTNRELVDEKLLGSCATAAANCMAAIGAGLGVSYLVWGDVDALGAIKLNLLDVRSRLVNGATTFGPGALSEAALSAFLQHYESRCDTTVTLEGGGIEGGTITVDGKVTQIVDTRAVIKGITPRKHVVKIAPEHAVPLTLGLELPCSGLRIQVTRAYGSEGASR